MSGDFFFYGLYDEYKGQSFCNSNRPFAPCSTDKPADISIMNTQWNAINTADDSLADARWLNFSTVQSGSTENANYRMYGTTSWETLIRTPDQDPPHPGNKRTYRHELLAKAPASGQAPSVELDTPEGIAAAAQDLQVIFKPGASQPTAARQSQNQPVEWIGTVRQIVIDHSTAVSSEYLSKIKAAAQTIVDDTELGDVIGIIAVDSEVNILQTLTTIDSEATRDALITRIENINSGTGLPFTGQALNTALQGLFDFGSLEQRTHSVYLLTHGTQASDDISIRVAAGELTRNDVLLFILGESQEVAINQLLLDAAESTGGEFYRATSPRRLQEALEQVHQLASPTVDVTIAHAFDEFEQHSSMDFYLDENLGKVYVTIEFEGTLENLQLSLLDPQDTTQPITLQQCQDVIQENKVPGEAKVELYHFCTQELLQPQVGLWTLQLDYTQTEAEAQQPDAHVETIITISALPKNNADSFFAAMWIEEPEPLIVGDSVTVFATLNADMPITGLQVTGTIETEDEQSIPMTLRDDGIAPDRIAQDGVYMGSFTPEAAGKYLVYADFNNTNNTAWYSNLGLFYAPDQDGNVPEQLLTPVNYLFQRFALKQVWVIE